jgi:tetratricopeptide (TPR) repeat protein
MAGNRAIYDRAMDQSREAAREGRWDDALKGAVRALQEFPKELEARTSVAVALFHTGKLAQALQQLQELHNADPGNPFYLEYIARAQERQGNSQNAISTYRMLLEMHQQQRSLGKTVAVLREILRISPDRDAEREQLARTLADTRATPEAVAEYLNLARRYQQQQRLDDAAERVEIALRLDPNNREAKDLIIALRQDMAHAAGLPTPEPAPGSEDMPETTTRYGSTGGLRSQQFALEKLVASATDKQEAGDNDGAIADYEEAVQGGLQRADVFYSLGLLYQERNDHTAAVEVLQHAATDPEYALSAHFALGSSYMELNQLPQAAQELEQAIGLVDLNTVGKNESEDLIHMYEQVTDIYQQLGDVARAAALYSTLANFLKSKRWGRERAEEFNRRAKDLTDQNMLAKLRSLGTGSLVPNAEPEHIPEPAEPVEDIPERWGKIPSIMDFLHSDSSDPATDALVIPAEAMPSADPLEMLENMPASEPVAVAPVTPLDPSGLDEQTERWLTASGRYIEQGLYDAALDACYEVMTLQPDYLPIHLRVGELFERQNLTEAALTKYQFLVDTHTVRDEPESAIDAYFRLINLSPDTTNARIRLADLLHQAGRIDESAEQLGYVADNYFRLGQTGRALEEYRRGIQWAPKNKQLRAQYGLALFKMERYEAALSEFHKAADPTDPVAIGHINMTLAMMAEQTSAIWDSLAALLENLPCDNNVLVSNVQAEYRTALLVADDPLLHYILGIIQQHCAQHSSALLEFEQGIDMLENEEHPILPRVLLHQAMASSYIELEQPTEALEQLRLGQTAAKGIKPDSSIKHSFARPLSQGELVWQMAEAYAAGDDLPSAEQALREALRLLPYNYNIYTKLADVCFRQGKLEEALSSLEDLATYYENRQDLDRAIDVLESALKLAPGSIAIGNRLAHLYIRRGYPDKGVDGLIRVAELQRRDNYIKDAVANLQQAAEIRWMQGQPDETLAIYDKIVAIAPTDIEARQWRAIMYTLVSRTAEAIAEKKEIANLLAQRKDYDNAIAELHQIIGLNTTDIDAYYMLGDMLMRRGEYNQALHLYQRMSKMDEVEAERLEALVAAANSMLKNQQMTSS